MSQEEVSQETQEQADSVVEEITGQEEEQETSEGQSEEVEVKSSEEEDSEEESKEEDPSEILKKLGLDTIKVNGKEKQIESLDELKQILSKAEGSDEKFREAAQIRKNVEAFAEALEKDPLGVLKQTGVNLNIQDLSDLEAMGLDVDSMLNKYMQQKIDEEQKSPEQKLKEEAEKYKKELEEERRKKEEIEQQRIYIEQAQLLQEEIISALSESDYLDKSPYDIKRVASAMKNGQLSAKDAVQMYEQEVVENLKSKVKLWKDKNKLASILGEDVLNDMRKERLQKAKKIVSPKDIKDTGKKDAKKEEAPQMTKEQFFEMLEQKADYDNF